MSDEPKNLQTLFHAGPEGAIPWCNKCQRRVASFEMDISLEGRTYRVTCHGDKFEMNTTPEGHVISVYQEWNAGNGWRGASMHTPNLTVSSDRAQLSTPNTVVSDRAQAHPPNARVSDHVG